jgi:putative addiction module component (TIGR02574 family)
MAEPKRVVQAALELPPGERADLLEAIAASLDGFEFGPEWEDEIRRRSEELDAGRVQAVPGEAVLSRLEQQLRAR